MMRKAFTGLVAGLGLAAVTLPPAPALAAPMSTTQPQAAQCVVAHGSRTSTRTWTEYITQNCAYLRVRARVICHDNFTGDNNVDYGGVINGTGSSYYKCNSEETPTSGHTQYYNGKKWVGISG